VSHRNANLCNPKWLSERIFWFSKWLIILLTMICSIALQTTVVSEKGHWVLWNLFNRVTGNASTIIGTLPYSSDCLKIWQITQQQWPSVCLYGYKESGPVNLDVSQASDVIIDYKCWFRVFAFSTGLFKLPTHLLTDCLQPSMYNTCIMDLPLSCFVLRFLLMAMQGVNLGWCDVASLRLWKLSACIQVSCTALRL